MPVGLSVRFFAPTLLAGTLLLLSMLSYGVETNTPSPQPRFDITRYEVTGNTLLDPAKIDALLAPYTGSQRSFSDVQNALEALQQAYAKAGFGAVQVRLPEQDLVQGTINFRVIEGHIHELAIEGNAFHDNANILDPLPLKKGETPNATRIESTLKVINENPSKKVQVALKSGPELGDIDATVKVVDQKPWTVGVILDNTGNKDTGSARLGVFYQNANMWDRDHVLTVQYTTSPDHLSDVSIFGAGYHVPLYQWGDSIDVFAGYSNVDSGTVSDLFSVSGSGTIYGARYNHNLTRHETYDHKIVLGYDQRAYRDDVQFNGSSQSLVPDITVRPVSLSYVGDWKALSQQLSFYATESANIEGGNHGSDADFEASRAGADANYMITRYGVDLVKLLDKDWRIHLNYNAQYTAQALVNGEQFGLGGMLGTGSVRGFHERELAGDRGYRISAEFYSPDFGSKINGNVNARALIFYDYGSLHNNNVQPGETSHTAIASVGAGLRVNIGTKYSLTADLGRVVNAGGQQNNGDMRGDVSLVLTY